MLRQIALQESVVYGPIHSRRLGSSLGINPLPLSRKACSSNCVYCQHGWTLPAEGSSEPVERAAELLALIDEAFKSFAEQKTAVDCITLAGNGEPTIHPDLEAIVLEVKRLRDRDFPKAKVGILSDATQAHRPGVARALRALDERYMKLDGGDEAMWRAVTQPFGGADWATMIAALKNLPDIVLQSMFIQGSVNNTKPDHIERWIELVRSIRPLSVQVYTVDRAPADPGIVKVPLARLQAIADRLTARTGIPADVYD